jgi:hypothetical protein
VGAAGATGSFRFSLLIPFTSMNTAQATIRKVTILEMKLP